MPAGHHATLSAEPDAPWLITTSPIRFGMVDTANAPVYTAEEYRSLAAGARFERIEAVPTVWKDAPESDCSRFPAREGFVDIMAVANEQEEGVPAWTVASKPAEGYLWFSLKDPAVLPTTVFWMENRGRHGAPWNGRNRCIGLEDVCAAFAGGMAASHADNPLRREGVRTLLDPDRSGRITVDYIEGVIAVPTDFGRATSVSFGDEVIRITGSDGSTVETPVAWKRIFGANE
jgi:hypothetical protein